MTAICPTKTKHLKAWKDNLVAYGFLSPWFIGFVVFTGGPIIASMVLSFTRWNLLGTPEFIGLGNYINMFAPGSGFLSSLRSTLIYTVIAVSVSVMASLVMAILLNFKVRFRPLFQFCFFVPAVMPSVVMAFVFRLIFHQEMGILNYVLGALGLSQLPNWLHDPFWVWVSLGVVTIFTYSTGQMMLIFNSALKEVPEQLYEAGEMEGVNFLQRLWYITLPSISPIILFNVVVGTVNSFNTAFSIIFPLTGGGPGNETMVLSLELYDHAFRMFNMGYASAVGVVLFLMVGAIGLVQFSISKNTVHYD